MSLALASSVPVLGLESVCPRKGCPWSWPRIFFCVLGLGLEPCVLDSTSGKSIYLIVISKAKSQLISNSITRGRSGKLGKRVGCTNVINS